MYTDPFGLCKEEQKDKDGKCPGGLTDKQWDRVEYAANNRMTKGARERVLALLNAGKIHAGLSWFEKAMSRLKGTDPAGVTNNLTDHISIREDAFEYQPGNLAMLLAHESQHTWQPLLMTPSMVERDADAYGCANTRGRSGSYIGGTYGNRFGNYCGGR